LEMLSQRQGANVGVVSKEESEDNRADEGQRRNVSATQLEESTTTADSNGNKQKEASTCQLLLSHSER
jgi:hypothetical protein